MARAGINRAQVEQAIINLKKENRYPSYQLIRQYLKNSGSYSTIGRLVRELKEENPALFGEQVDIPDAILKTFNVLSGQLRAEARKEAEQTEKKFLEAADEQEKLYEDLRKEYDELHHAHQELQDQLAEKTVHEDNLNKRLQEKDIEIASLKTEQKNCEKNLDDKTEQITTLEAKFNQLYQQHKHYQEASKQERDTLRADHDRQLTALQGEIKTLKETVAGKLEAISFLNNDNIRLTSELNATQRELQDKKDTNKKQAQEIKELQAKNEALDNKRSELEKNLNDTQNKLQNLSEQHKSLQQTIKQLKSDLDKAGSEINTLSPLLNEIQELKAMIHQQNKTRQKKG